MWYLPDEAEASLVPENESLEQEWMYTYNTQRLMEKFTIMCKPELATELTIPVKLRNLKHDTEG